MTEIITLTVIVTSLYDYFQLEKEVNLKRKDQEDQMWAPRESNQ